MDERTSGTGEARRLMLLDTASLYFRAFFGLPNSLRAPDQTPVNAVRGLADFIARLVTDASPTHLVACWDDDWRPQWRVDVVPSYKTHRVAPEVGDGVKGATAEAVDAELDVQVPVIVEMLDVLGLARWGAPRAEADDVIGTLAPRAAADGAHVDVVTGDRDLLQLVTERVEVLWTGGGMSKLARWGVEDVVAGHGVLPEQYADLAAMRGDSSDGIPGVAGIGAKTGAALLHRFGTLEEILAAAQADDRAIAPGQRAKLVAGADAARAARRVIGVVGDLDLPDWRTADLTAWTPARQDAWAAFAERWGLGSSAERLADAMARNVS